ncbi:alpha/beta fold hydrolase [Aliivibrio fischeri]|uniref:alpha/beta fold hydrolase n=1 Tax=Aliivibrio fischeri TaxID=668 RepID=UPI0002E241A9|nr:alpha/beta hydrolase [Aliivibrio fischeri]OEE22705.1 hydrolase [Aliivibrio fischeri ZF-211]
MSLFHERSLPLYHGEIALLEVKPEQVDQTILFLHGWQDNAATFLTTMESYAKTNPTHHLIAFDWFGHGLSSHKGGDNFYHFFDYIDDLHQVILHLNQQSVILVGHSLGGLIASAYCAAFPEKVSALMMIEALGPLSEDEDQITDRLRQGILSRQRYRNKPQRTLKDAQSALELRAKVNQLPQSLIEPMVLRSLRVESEYVQWTTDAKVKCDSLYRMSETHALALLDKIECPVFAVVGLNGYGHLKQKEHRYKFIADFTCYHIKGGHHCHLENPNLISEHLTTLINTITT